MAADNPPTEAKLARLRENGIVPYSKVATFCILILLLIISFTISFDYFTDTTVQIKNDNVSELLNEFWLVLLPAAATLLGGLFVVLLQTKFLLKPKLVIPQFARITPFNGFFSISSIFSRVAVGIFELCLFLVISAIVTYIAFVIGMRVFYLPPQEALFSFNGLSVKLLPVLIFLCLICIVLGILLSHLLFRFRHRMTREELELEERG